MQTVSEYVKSHLEQFRKVYFVVRKDEEKIVFEQLLRHLGKDEDARVSLANCKKCNKRIRIRKKNYDQFVIDGFIPSYCNTCAGETYEQRTCVKCGASFSVTYKEKDQYEQRRIALPTICAECR